MVKHISAIKRARQNEKLKQLNKHYKSAMKSAIKGVLSSNDKASAQKKLTSTVSILDKMASRGIIHKNKAANQKSRLTKFVNKM